MSGLRRAARGPGPKSPDGRWAELAEGGGFGFLGLSLSRRGLLSCFLLGCLLAGGGCDRHFFRAQGFVASEGGALGVWRSTPEACTRAPFDGRPPGESESIVTLLWEDPSLHDPMRDQHRAKAQNAPLRLELARDGQGYRVGLVTVRNAGMRIESADCAVLRVNTEEEVPVVAGAREGLGGRVEMDCRVRGSHVTADVLFVRCEF